MTYWILLASGAAYHFGDSAKGKIDPDADIVVPLSGLPRFGNQRRPGSPRWTVLAHQLAAFRLADQWGYPPEAQWLAGHHDDHEALVGDWTSPMKEYLRSFGRPVVEAIRTLNDAARRACAAATGGRLAGEDFSWVLRADIGNPAAKLWRETDLIRRVDLALLLAERDHFMSRVNLDAWECEDEVPAEDRHDAGDVVHRLLVDHQNDGTLLAQEYRATNRDVEAAIAATGRAWPYPVHAP